jgi:hypothetical protein
MEATASKLAALPGIVSIAQYDRYPKSDGGFNVRGSSEVPMGDLVPMLEFVAEHDELSLPHCAAIMKALAESIMRQSS